MATRDGSDLEPLDKVRLVLDYAPAEALESIADDEEERQLLASLDERIDRRVQATRVRDATVVVERPQVVEVLGVTCDDCGTLFEVEADDPLPRPAACPSCGAEGTVEAQGDAAAFALDEEEEPEADLEAGLAAPEPPEVPEPEEELEEGTDEEAEPATEAFAVPEEEGDRSAVLVPSEADDAPSMQPAVDPVDALTPDEEPEETPQPAETEGRDETERAVEDILEPEEGAVETPDTEAEEEEAEDEDDEYTFTPPTAEEEDEGDDAVQDLLDEDLDLDVDEEDETQEGGREEEERGEAFDDVEWHEEVEDEAFIVVAPMDEDGDEAPDPEEELVEPEEEAEEDWPESEPVDDEVDEPEWPELEDEEAEGDEEEPDWPELDDEEAGENPSGSEADAGNPGTAADEVPEEWAGRDLEDEADGGGAAAGARGGLPVDQIPGIEAFYADQLAASGYETTADLAADEPWKVADETGIASALIRKWSRAATLVQDLGMGAGYAQVLAEAEVGGPDELRARDPKDLAETVNDLLAESDQDLDPVTPETAASWTGGA